MNKASFNERYIKVRRNAIAADFSHLNDMQQQAVLTTEGPLLLLAGAGSGKTTVLINRIANLLRYGKGSDCNFVPDTATEEDIAFLEDYCTNPDGKDYNRVVRLCSVEPVEPWRIIAITFTNKAAGELKERLQAMLGPEAGDIWAMTFHSACVRILRKDIEKLGFDRSFTIYDTTDSLSLIKRILKEYNMDDKVFPPRSILAQISSAKDAMCSPETFAEEAKNGYDIRKRDVAKVYATYVKRLKEANALDFDDIILFTVKLLMEHSDVREYYQKKFRHVLIDEYQDTNNLQYLLASTLAGGHKNICVVGDDDQSIYKFRGATIENILNFEKQYKNSRVIRLEQNYRSTGHILAASNGVIRHNQGRKGKQLWTNHDDGSLLKLYVAQNENDEAQYVAGQILASVANGSSWRSHAVLYRMNAQSNQLEYAFKRNGIPYRVIGGLKFFDRAEIKDILSYLCVINNPADDLRLTRIINTPVRGIGAKTVSVAADIAAVEGRPIYNVLRDCRRYSELERSSGKLMLFVNMIDELRELAPSMQLDEFYDAVLEKSGYLKALTEEKTNESLTRQENINELKSNIVEYMKNNAEPSLAGFLDEIALYTDIEQYDADSDCAVMMTMHSAKGLEFPTVFIVGAEDGIFPGLKSIGEPEEMEEERRLCYVAMTRAKEKLYITCAKQRMLFGRTSANKMSRFIDEIPEEDIEKPVLQRFTSGGFASGTESPRSRFSTPKPASHISNITKSIQTPPPAAPSAFKEGDCVKHTVFGSGVIIKLKPVGNDALLEVNFENIGVKRLMLKSASAHMTCED